MAIKRTQITEDHAPSLASQSVHFKLNLQFSIYIKAAALNRVDRKTLFSQQYCRLTN
jgi:hypothetical protein